MVEQRKKELAEEERKQRRLQILYKREKLHKRLRAKELQKKDYAEVSNFIDNIVSSYLESARSVGDIKEAYSNVSIVTKKQELDKERKDAVKRTKELARKNGYTGKELTRYLRQYPEEVNDKCHIWNRIKGTIPYKILIPVSNETYYVILKGRSKDNKKWSLQILYTPDCIIKGERKEESIVGRIQYAGEVTDVVRDYVVDIGFIKDIVKYHYKGDKAFSVVGVKPAILNNERNDGRYVYIMQSPSIACRFKVGFSKDPDKRAKQVMGSTPLEAPTILDKRYTRYYKELESYLHNKYPREKEWLKGAYEDIRDDLYDWQYTGGV